MNIDYFPALFHRIPALAERVPWQSLRGAEIPSDPVLLKRAQHLFGTNYIFIKNEGNDLHIIPEHHAKKLEFLLASDALQKAKTWVTSGNAGDFHCLSVAKAGHELGHSVEIILRKSTMTAKQVEAIMAMMNLGAKVRLRETEKGFRWSMAWNRFLSRFFSRALIPKGGSAVEAVWGGLNAFAELESQIRSGVIPEPNYIVVPVTTGATLAGFEIGKRLLGMENIKIQGMATYCESEGLKPRLADWANQVMGELKKHLGNHVPPYQFSEKDFFVDTTFQAHKPLSLDIQRWLVRFLELEQFDMDFEISGRSMYAMHRWIERKNLRDQKVLFWSVSSAVRSGDFGKFAGFSRLPKKLRRWIKSEQSQGRLAEIGAIPA